MKTERFEFEVCSNELNIVPLTEISKKDFLKYLECAKTLEKNDDKTENYHGNNYMEKDGETTITRMWRFTVNTTDLYLYRTTCKEGYRLLTEKEKNNRKV